MFKKCIRQFLVLSESNIPRMLLANDAVLYIKIPIITAQIIKRIPLSVKKLCLHGEFTSSAIDEVCKFPLLVYLDLKFSANLAFTPVQKNILYNKLQHFTCYSDYDVADAILHSRIRSIESTFYTEIDLNVICENKVLLRTNNIVIKNDIGGQLLRIILQRNLDVYRASRIAVDATLRG